MIRSADARSPFAEPMDRPAVGIDWWLLGSTALLVGIGLAVLKSIDLARGTSFFVRQALFAALGVVLMVGISRIRSGAWRKVSPWLYGLSLALLGSVLFLGDTVKGATRWIEIGPIQFQPSEFAKLALIVTLSTFWVNHWERRRELGTFVLSMLHALPVAGLVFIQPHLAGGVSLLVIWLAVSLAAGARWTHLLAALVAAAALGAVALTAPGLLTDYQRARIESKLSPDSQKGAWQQRQAEIAFGVGGVTGVGFGKGEQKASRYVPEQQNDFVFTVVGEEGGFIGSVVVMLVYLAFFVRVWIVGFRATDPFGLLTASGVLAILGFHAVLNLGMTLGLLPVAGMWLPFLSYGGTALWLCLGCVGLLLSVR